MKEDASLTLTPLHRIPADQKETEITTEKVKEKHKEIYQNQNVILQRNAMRLVFLRKRTLNTSLRHYTGKRGRSSHNWKIPAR